MKQATKYFIALSALVIAIIFTVYTAATHNKNYRFRSVEERVMSEYKHRAWADSVDAARANVNRK